MNEWKRPKDEMPDETVGDEPDIEFTYRGEDKVWSGCYVAETFVTENKEGQRQGILVDEERSKDVIAWRYREA